MTSAVIYTRISADREGKALGVERQEEQCRALAARHGYDVVKVYCDNDISASRHSRKVRPQYRDMLTAARKHEFSVILAATSGRLTRRPRELEDLLDLFDAAGTTFAYVKSPAYDLATAAGRKFARYAAADDAAESDEISERVTDRLNQRKAAGLPHGGQRPYGWEPDRMTIREAEAQWIRWGVQQTLAGVPIRTQFRELNERGVTNSRGGAWTHATYRGVITTERHAGLMRDGQTRATWPQIITPEQYRAVLRILRDPARVTTPGRAGKLHLLSGLARCGICGGPLRVGKSSGNNRQAPYSTLRCHPSGHIQRNRDHVEGFVLAVIAERLRRPDAAQLLAVAEDETQRTARLAADAEAQRLRQLIDDAAEDHGRAGLPISALAAYTAPLREQLAAAEKAATPPLDRDAALGDVARSADPGAAFLALPVDRQRIVIELLISIKVGKGPRGNVFRPDGIEIKWKGQS
jgi:site-specific DNA recombinase